MPHPDALRWNTRYQEDNLYSFNQPRPFLEEVSGFLPANGMALDAAMGLGGNAGFLLRRGLQVIGVDVSDIALRQARTHYPEIQAVQADLTQFHLPASTFDVILNFYYLERSLWPVYPRALKAGGVLVMETLLREMNTIHPEINPIYLLAPGELRRAFPPWRPWYIVKAGYKAVAITAAPLPAW